MVNCFFVLQILICIAQIHYSVNSNRQCIAPANHYYFTHYTVVYAALHSSVVALQPCGHYFFI